LEADCAVIDVEGKHIRVPLTKLSAGVKTGDAVVWTGDRWAGQA
jgi:hypothetical protein